MLSVLFVATHRTAIYLGCCGVWLLLLTFIGIPFILANQAFLGQLTLGRLRAAVLYCCCSAYCLCLGGIIATVVYNGNRFYLTNESVTSTSNTVLFSQKEQTISLANIEDASFRQHGIIQHSCNYGSLRLSTEGDETTYRFNYVANPQNQVRLLNNAVEAFKNGRPVNPEDD